MSESGTLRKPCIDAYIGLDKLLVRPFNNTLITFKSNHATVCNNSVIIITHLTPNVGPTLTIE